MRVFAWCLVALVATADLQGVEVSVYAATYERARRSIVLVTALDSDGEEVAQGSGFVATSDGRIVTNLHVVEGASSVRVTFFDDRTVDVTELAASDPSADIAVLRVNSGTVPHLKVAESTPHVGDEVIAIGNPLSLQSTLSNGLVSGVRVMDGVLVIQTTAPISSGSSGGALLSLSGEVIGVTSFQLRDAQNLNFAIAAWHVRDVLTRSNASPFPGPVASPKHVESPKTEPLAPLDDHEFKQQVHVDGMMREYNRLKTYSERVRFLNTWISWESVPAIRGAALLLRGAEHETHGRQEEALESFEAALRDLNDANTSMNPLYYRLCRSYLINRRYHEAIDACEAAVDEARGNENDEGQLANSWSHLGQANEELGRYDDAVTAYEQALVVDPNDKRSLKALAKIYDRREEKAKRRALCGQLKQQNPTLWREIFGSGC